MCTQDSLHCTESLKSELQPETGRVADSAPNITKLAKRTFNCASVSFCLCAHLDIFRNRNIDFLFCTGRAHHHFSSFSLHLLKVISVHGSTALQALTSSVQTCVEPLCVAVLLRLKSTSANNCYNNSEKCPLVYLWGRVSIYRSFPTNLAFHF